MDNIRPILQAALPDDFVGVGVVTSARDGAPYWTVQVSVRAQQLEVLAVKAADLVADLIVGDRVLCVCGVDRVVYISALLERAADTMSDGDSLSSADKASARMTSREGRDVLAVFNRRNELIFEYDPENDRSRVVVDSGSLDFSVPDGDIKFCSGGKIQLESRTIAMTAGEASAVEKSSIKLGQFKTDIKSSILNIQSAQAKFELDKVFYVGSQLLSRVSRANLQWDKLQTLADSVVQKVRTSFSEVEELSQIKAGRMRTLVSGAFRLKSERVNIKSEKTVNIDGERINLG